MATTNRLSLLDGLRLLAAISVVLYHAQLTNPDFGLFERGYLFVDFFFLLSGFVLTIAAEDRMNASGGALRFLRARVARLWPVIVIGALIGAVFRTLETGQSVRMLLVQAMLLLPDIRHGGGHGVGQGGLIFPLNGPHWSMMLEVIANLAHALVIRRLPDRVVLAVAALGGIVLAITILLFGSATFGPDASNWWMGLARVGFSYPFGVWLARRWKRGNALRAQFPARLAPRSLAWVMALLLPVGLILALPLLPVRTAVGDATAILFVFPPLLWLAALATPPQVAGKGLHLAGLLSFPLYAVHLPIIQYVGGLNPGAAGQGLAVVACLLAAALVAQVPPLRALRPAPRFGRRPRIHAPLTPQP